MSKNYLTIMLHNKIYSQRTPNSKFIELDFKGNELNKYNNVPSEVIDIMNLYKDIEENPKKYMDFEILFNDTIKITKIYNHSNIISHFKIPDFIEGYPVSIIGENVLEDDLRFKLNQIDIPDSVDFLLPSAFSNALALKVFYMPENLKIISEKCFLNCINLSNVFFNNVKEINNSAFEGCKSLKNIDLSSIKRLGSFAFSRCISLKNIKLSNFITSIPTGIFYGCDSLAKITIPDSVSMIFDNAFACCDHLTEININKKTEYSDDAFTYKQLLNLKIRKELNNEGIEI